eukprot:365764_1
MIESSFSSDSEIMSATRVSVNESIINGYIRKAEQLLPTNRAYYNIPYSINSLCFMYYYEFILIQYTFAIINRHSFGFVCQLSQLHSRFIIVEIQPSSQSDKFGIKADDILISCEQCDLSPSKSMNNVSTLMTKIANIGKNSHSYGCQMTFGRDKSKFPILLCNRAGNDMVNGKYCVQGTEENAFLFVNQNNSNLVIHVIYLDEEEDEVIWALSMINIAVEESNDSQEITSKDCYVVLSDTKQQIPPTHGWEAVEPNGLWPAPGLTFYNITSTDTLKEQSDVENDMNTSFKSALTTPITLSKSALTAQIPNQHSGVIQSRNPQGQLVVKQMPYSKKTHVHLNIYVELPLDDIEHIIVYFQKHFSVKQFLDLLKNETNIAAFVNTE